MLPNDDLFSRIAKTTNKKAGQPIFFGIALVLVVVALLTGPIFIFSETWQLGIVTGATVIIFLMVFLIQNSLHHENTAIHLKLDELIRASGGSKALLEVEELTGSQLDSVKTEYSAANESAPDPEPTPEPESTPDPEPQISEPVSPTIELVKAQPSPQRKPSRPTAKKAVRTVVTKTTRASVPTKRVGVVAAKPNTKKTTPPAAAKKPAPKKKR